MITPICFSCEQRALHHWYGYPFSQWTRFSAHFLTFCDESMSTHLYRDLTCDWTSFKKFTWSRMKWCNTFATTLRCPRWEQAPIVCDGISMVRTTKRVISGITASNFPQLFSAPLSWAHKLIVRAPHIFGTTRVISPPRQEIVKTIYMQLEMRRLYQNAPLNLSLLEITFPTNGTGQVSKLGSTVSNSLCWPNLLAKNMSVWTMGFDNTLVWLLRG